MIFLVDDKSKPSKSTLVITLISQLIHCLKYVFKGMLKLPAHHFVVYKSKYNTQHLLVIT